MIGVSILRPSSRIAGLVVLGFIVLSSMPALALLCADSDQAVGRTVSCHGHGKTDGVPRNHQCCLARHHSALPASAFSTPLLLDLCLLKEINSTSIPGRFISCYSESLSPPLASHRFSPLRI
jgi:hypothetical protein